MPIPKRYHLGVQGSGHLQIDFLGTQGGTQDGPLLSTIFNIIVDAVVQEWLRHVVSAKSANSGIIREDLRRFLTCFYADDGLVVSQDPDLL